MQYYEDGSGNDGNVWIGTWDDGLLIYSPVTNRFTNYPFIRNDYTNIIPKDSLDDDQVTNLILTAKASSGSVRIVAH